VFRPAGAYRAIWPEQPPQNGHPKLNAVIFLRQNFCHNFFSSRRSEHQQVAKSRCTAEVSESKKKGLGQKIAGRDRQTDTGTGSSTDFADFRRLRQ